MEIMDNMMLQGTIFLSLLWLASPQDRAMLVPEEWFAQYLLNSANDVIIHTKIELWKLFIQRQSLRGNAAYEIGFLIRTTEDRAMLVPEEWFAQYLLTSANDVIIHTKIELWKLFIQRQSLRGNAAYEIGFLIRTTEERYRKMVDLYNVSMTMDSVLRTRDHILHLQKIEKLHWDILHLANMLHEVERKYAIKRSIRCDEPDESLTKVMAQLSWSTKSKLLDWIDVKTNLSKTHGARRTRSLQEESEAVWNTFEGRDDDDAYNDVLYNRSHLDSEHHIRRARSLGAALLNLRTFNDTALDMNKDVDEDVMKMKLFRLMYESVKDSDLKIKRAELIKVNYENSTGFDMGYVFGDATDKLNVMADVSKTLKRMYNVWKPVEHVNAYEQVANLAIEVSHLVDMIHSMAVTPLPPLTSVNSIYPPG